MIRWKDLRGEKEWRGACSLMALRMASRLAAAKMLGSSRFYEDVSSFLSTGSDEWYVR